MVTILNKKVRTESLTMAADKTLKSTADLTPFKPAADLTSSKQSVDLTSSKPFAYLKQLRAT